MKLINLLFEYSEKFINTTIERWKDDVPTLDDSLARQIILRFDQIKSGISSKLNIVALSDDLRKGNRYLNIDHYSLDDMVKLLRSIPEKDDKIKKDAIKKFMEAENIDRGIATHYVMRFLNARKDLKYAMENGTEDGNFTKEEVNKFIPPRLKLSNSELDPRAWSYSQIEHMLDALFPYRAKVKDGEEGDVNTAETNADLIYNKNNLEVYKGDAQHKCVQYNPTKDGRKAYGWCIAQPGNSNYDYYRFQQGTNRMFYICFDRDQPEVDPDNPLDANFHAFVIHVGENGAYWVTGARNNGDKLVDSWEDLGKVIAPSTWEKLKGLQNVFGYIPPSKAEISSAALRGKRLSASDFRELDYDTKEQYVQSNSGRLSREILGVLDKDLKNLAINYGQKFAYNELEESEQLLKRYAVFRFRHTDYKQDPIPLPFVKYLDGPAKELYIKEYDNQLNFDYVKHYFGEDALTNYINRKVKELGFITPEYVQRIEDPKYKAIYSLYNKLTKNWEFDKDFGLDENALENMEEMPEQGISPKTFQYEDFKQLSSSEIKLIINLAETLKGEKYEGIILALPYIVKTADQYLFLLPTETTNEKWALVDENKRIVKTVPSSATLAENETLTVGFPDYVRFNKIYPIENLKGANLNETKYSFIAEIALPKRAKITQNPQPKQINESYLKNIMMNRAGLL